MIRIATRKSPLALWQAEYVKKSLLTSYPAIKVELIKLSTQGDKILDTPLAKIGGKALFVKELEQALLDGKADIAVHSMKDVPVDLPEGLAIEVICQRADPRDAFVSNDYKNLQSLPEGAVVGTSSLRRQCQLLALYPGIIIQALRGNVGTRLSKLDGGEFAAIVLAASGLSRLGLAHRITQHLAPEICLPAVAQGALGIECRKNDERIIKLLSPLHHLNSALCVTAERAVNARLSGGCQVPIAAHAALSQNQLAITALVGSVDGRQIIRQSLTGSADQAQLLGTQLAERLLELGAGAILEQLST